MPTPAFTWAARRVALLAEGVDRNCSVEWHGFSPCVALLAEGVDRNHHLVNHLLIVCGSPSSRRAWIEIA